MRGIRMLKGFMRETTVVNIRTDEYDVQIDRTTRWGNPFPIGKHSRREVIELYKQWISKEIQEGRITREDLNTLRGQRLGCWCKPLSCHGDVLAKLADSIEDPPSF